MDLRSLSEVRKEFRNRIKDMPQHKIIDDDHQFWLFWGKWTAATSKSDNMQEVKYLLELYKDDINQYSNWMRIVRELLANWK